MSTYIDGFIFPIALKHLETYQEVAQQVAKIWQEYGALSYQEYQADSKAPEGLRSFGKTLALEEGEVAIFGWVVFPSIAIRERASKQVPLDPRMERILAPLGTSTTKQIFDASRMVYGGFKPLVELT